MKDKIVTFMFIFYLVLFAVLGILFKDEEISYSERRKLATFPEGELNSTYISKVDKYFLDHFPFREEFRSIKANYNYKVLRMSDNNGIYLKDNYIFKSIYPTNKKSVDNFIGHYESVQKLFPEKEIYTMIVPDKNYYLEEDNFLNIDYNYIYDEMKKLGTFIDIRDSLFLSAYYETDTHWREEKLGEVIKKMSEVMDFNYYDVLYEEKTYDDFYGVYYGSSALKRGPEKLTYLESQELREAEVTYLENSNLKSIYNEDNLEGLDSYGVFLDGASSFIELVNKKAEGGNLVIFRDSFGSSLVPLLVPYYKKIIVIDNRYITSSHFKDLVDIEDFDILLLYSTLLVNDSFSLKN